MGALHSGHVELIAASQASQRRTMVSIFVNPTQFLPGEDLEAYPRPLERDLQMLSEIGVDYAFVPRVDEMYAAPPYQPHGTFVNIEGIDETLEGSRRPGHFKGVATVCTKLFNIVQPHVAFFGAKDGMQCIVIKRIVRELNIPVKIVIVPTSRDADGLARSSRNVYLSPSERAIAPVLYAALQRGEQLYHQGERKVQTLRHAVLAHLSEFAPNAFQPQYVALTDTFTGQELEGVIGESTPSKPSATTCEQTLPSIITQSLHRHPTMLSIAAKLGRTRLIDNLVLPPDVKSNFEYD